MSDQGFDSELSTAAAAAVSPDCRIGPFKEG